MLDLGFVILTSHKMNSWDLGAQHHRLKGGQTGQQAWTANQTGLIQVPGQLLSFGGENDGEKNAFFGSEK